MEESSFDFYFNSFKFQLRTDIDEKTISRAFPNGSNSEIIVEFGLGFSDGLSVDWNAGNVYWTDMTNDRIEVARVNGSSRRVIVWKDLEKPSSIALHPRDGIMFFSTWGKAPAIEQV